jgi:hypothetical protein
VHCDIRHVWLSVVVARHTVEEMVLVYVYVFVRGYRERQVLPFEGVNVTIDGFVGVLDWVLV